jgi:hypothetical protein
VVGKGGEERAEREPKREAKGRSGGRDDQHESSKRSLTSSDLPLPANTALRSYSSLRRRSARGKREGGLTVRYGQGRREAEPDVDEHGEFELIWWSIRVVATVLRNRDEAPVESLDRPDARCLLLHHISEGRLVDHLCTSMRPCEWSELPARGRQAESRARSGVSLSKVAIRLAPPLLVPK